MLDKNRCCLKNSNFTTGKKYGVGTLMRLGDKPHQVVDVIPTGALNLDIALGIGGIPKGRITEIYGAEASGKTTLALHIAGRMSKTGWNKLPLLMLNLCLDPIYAKRLGVITDDLLLSQPDGGEQERKLPKLLFAVRQLI